MKIRLSERNLVLKSGVSILFGVCGRSIRYFEVEKRTTAGLALFVGFVILMSLLFWKDHLDAREEKLANRDRNNELNRLRRL